MIFLIAPLHPCVYFGPCFADFSGVSSHATRFSLISCFSTPLFYLPSSSPLTFMLEYLNASWVHSSFCLPFSCTARTLIKKCMLRREGLPPYWEQSLLTTGKVVSSRLCLSPFFSCSYFSSCCWQWDNVVRWGKTCGSLTVLSAGHLPPSTVCSHYFIITKP